MPRDDTLTKLCNDVTSTIETRLKQQHQNLSEQRYVRQPLLTGSTRVIQKGAQPQASLTITFPLLHSLLNHSIKKKKERKFN